MSQLNNLICGVGLAMCGNIAFATNTIKAIDNRVIEQFPQFNTSNPYQTHNFVAPPVLGLKGLPGGGSVLAYDKNGNVVCRHATAEEAQELVINNVSIPLRTITKFDENNGNERITQEQNGLRITLQATEQLENFPEAKAAFLRAAKLWESIIASPVSIIINVDYGPNRFGMPFRMDALASATSQLIERNFSQVRAALIDGANTQEERSLYETLPLDEIPTDIGNTSSIRASSAVFRALGLVSATADPNNETDFGTIPSIGFSLDVNWDFNPDDGIDAGKIDFFGAAVHEIGHALGFTSEVGSRGLNPNAAVAVSLWDLFRFRPQTGGDFTNAQRILSPGGEQVFYAGDAELPLSTGGPAADNGDGQQASHWKDDGQTGVYIGVMDPTIGEGFRVTVSQNDRLALDAMGYTLATGIDDGSFESTIGPANGGTAFYINRLTPNAYPATLTQVLVQFTNSSNVSAGSRLNILMGTNQSGGSDIDSTQFQSTPATVSELDAFIGFDVPDVTIDSGDFIVGFSMTTDQDIFPGALDTTTYQQRSYFSVDGVDFELIDIATGGNLPGNFGIRARINR